MLGKLTSVLPHYKMNLPLMAAPRKRMGVYLDDQLGYIFNRREPSVVSAYTDFIHEGALVFDIGAYIGYFTLLAVSEGATVHAFEPDLANQDRLKSNLQLNNIEDSVKVIPKAVSDQNCGETLFDGPNRSQQTLGDAPPSSDGKRVGSVTLDEYCRSIDLEPDVIKVDVEGAADKVFDEAKNIIERGKGIWIIELHDNTEERAFNQYFVDGGYQTESLAEGHMIAQR